MRERVRAKALTRERVSAKNEVLPRFYLELARYASKNADLCFTGQIRLRSRTGAKATSELNKICLNDLYLAAEDWHLWVWV